jgi:DNA-binding MarR family transcriptional regulator
MVASGHVERVTNPEDRRAAFVCLTPAGRRAFAQMAERHAVWIAELFEGLNEGDVAQLMRLLGRMKQSVREAVR